VDDGWDQAPPVTFDLGGSVLGIDTAMGGFDGITAGYLIASSRPCLVETGTALSAPTVRRALSDAGLGPDDLATIVVTHIHLDHAGGVGHLARAFPTAQVVVHEAGARHLVDPSRLLASAALVFGPDLDALFGPMLAVPAERLRAIGAEGAVDLGDGRTLRAHHSPGHARHHLGLLDSETGDLYVGDAAGIYVPEAGLVRPATPPPDFDLELALASLRRFAAEEPNRLLFSHFGPVLDVAGALEQSGAELIRWVDLVRGTRADGLDLDHAVARVREETAERYAAILAAPAVAAKFERLNSVGANVSGILHWLDRLEQATAAAG
jgi:glyoxylase-like metal-dependent hydrolase (beta-lactamase superfamily II)